jgi:hypothetical protein
MAAIIMIPVAMIAIVVIVIVAIVLFVAVPMLLGQGDCGRERK